MAGPDLAPPGPSGPRDQRPAPPQTAWDAASQAYAPPIGDLLEKLGVTPETGLSSDEAARRLKHYGPNQLRAARTRGWIIILIDQFRSLLIWLLLAAALLSLIYGDWLEAAAILAVVAINTAIGFTAEWKAVRSVAALRQLAQVESRVLRDGRAQMIPADGLVPGDIVFLEGGDIVTADLRLIEASKLQADESALSGEALPVGKAADASPLPENTPLVERRNMAFKGTAITRGSAKGVVAATGLATELGNIAQLTESAEAALSPLERRLAKLSNQLLWFTLGIAALLAASGIYAGKDMVLMIETAIALAVAAVPEGMPIVATLALARGMWRMSKRNVLVENLSAVEALGATTVILTDKTGTLTENRMTVTDIVLPGGHIALGGADIQADEGGGLAHLLKAAALCVNAELLPAPETETPEGVGDPMEVALLHAARHIGLYRPRLLEGHPEIHEDAFDPEVKMMATFHQLDDSVYAAIKGAPEAVIGHARRLRHGETLKPLNEADKAAWLAQAAALGRQGMRVLAIAEKTDAALDTPPYEALTLLGLVGFSDPPRADVPDAVRICRRAGIKVVMATGDQAHTAAHIAHAVGLTDGPDAEVREGRHLQEMDGHGKTASQVYARVSPEQKLDLIAAFQQAGEIVAMTGDGVNDAPALKKADIGIAMGKRGTQVAREAADMILRDDAFASIVAAIEQGRVIFGNIRKFVLYLLSCNLSEVLIVAAATLSGLPLPLTPLQILFLNLVTDVFSAFALGAGEGEPGLMRRPPRNPREGILGRRHWLAIIGYGGLITGSVLAAFLLSLYQLHLNLADAVTISFLTLACAQLAHVFNMRDAGSRPLRNEITGNPYIWGALALSALVIGVALYVPLFAEILNLRPPDKAGWALIAGASFAPLLIGQIFKFFPARHSLRRDARRAA